MTTIDYVKEAVTHKTVFALLPVKRAYMKKDASSWNFYSTF